MNDALLQITAVKKSFPGVRALDGVDLHVAEAEVHALLGENGAGKSTLLKILSGAQTADEGHLNFDGTALKPGDTPARRQQLGIVTIYQEFNLLPALSVAENMYIGREPKRGFLIDWTRMYRDAQKILDDMGVALNAKTEVRTLTVAGQQMVEIAKALTVQAKLIVMDEPTAALCGREVEKLHEIVRDLKKRGISVIYVSHKLGEVKTICDRYTVFRDGRYVTSGAVADVTVRDLIKAMVGRDVIGLKRARTTKTSDVAPTLQVTGVSRAAGGASSHAMRLHDMSVDVRSGEIVGFAGLVGAGRTELARIILGADRCDSGLISIDGIGLTPLKSPQHGLASGIALVPEDRKQQGCFLTQSIRQNMSLPSLSRLRRWGLFIDAKAEDRLIDEYRGKLQIKMANDQVMIGTLSGGNQQKVLLARFMALKPKVLIVDEPTRGIDVGAKAEVHQVLFDMADAGVAVIVISSELQEVMAVSDRIVTFKEGGISGVVPALDATEESLMELMALGEAELVDDAKAA